MTEKNNIELNDFAVSKIEIKTKPRGNVTRPQSRITNNDFNQTALLNSNTGEFIHSMSKPGTPGQQS